MLILIRLYKNIYKHIKVYQIIKGTWFTVHGLKNSRYRIPNVKNIIYKCVRYFLGATDFEPRTTYRVLFKNIIN